MIDLVNFTSEQCIDVINSLNEGIFIINKSFKILQFNKAAEEITGWKREEVIGRYCYEIFSANICGETCILKKCMDEIKTATDEVVFINTKKSGRIPVSISAAPLKDNSGQVVGGVEIFRDISESLKIKFILNSVTEGIFSVDQHRRITSFNKAAEKITGYKFDEVKGKKCHEVFKADICDKNCAIDAAMRSKGIIKDVLVNIISKDGRTIPIKINAYPILDDHGEIIGAVEIFKDMSELITLRKQLSKRFTFSDIITKSKKILNILEKLPDIAKSDSTVLITGESGTGKELIARAIHNLSNRFKGPFVAINCGAIPDTLLESELFGYKAGAFTDAKRDKPGKITIADKGTLFLDEIGDISHSFQVKLLRFLQEKIYEPLGSTKSQTADVRIIAATNKDLKELVKTGAFREDLFYRLNVVNIHLPPLRERKEDIPILVDHFIKKYNAIKDKLIEGITNAALTVLLNYDFPGNIRELENIIEYTFVVCHDNLIDVMHLPEYLLQSKTSTNEINLFNIPMTLEQAEKLLIVNALKRNKGKIMATCRELGIKSKDTLRKKIKEYGIDLSLIKSEID